jgi:cyanophycin synthetase
LPALVELRVLEGPNLYFPRAAVKLTLDVSALTTCDEPQLRVLASALGLSVRAGEPRSGFRQRAVTRLVTRLVRRIAREAGTTRLGLRVRGTSDPDVVVVAFPWRDRNRAQALGEAVAVVLDSLDATRPTDLGALVADAAAKVAGTEPGPGPTTIRPRVPVVAVTGTNGKTTTSRMIAHIAREAGFLVGWSNTDGIYVDGELVEAGDYSGPSRRPRAAGSSSRGSASPTTTSPSSPTSVPTTSACRASTPSTSSPRSRPSYRGSPRSPAGRC